jgi:alkylation response protein AidB-like acyl-CoA dehydrogenase
MARMRRVLDDILATVAERGGVPDATAVKLGKLVERVETGRTMAYNTAAYLSRGEGFPPHMPSVLKLSGGAVGRSLGELATELLGLGVSDSRMDPWNFWGGWLHSFASSIAGGSDEIQHDIIGTRYFGIAS